MGVAAGFTHRGNLVVKCCPVLRQNELAGYDDIDLLGALLDGISNFGKPLRQRGQAGGKPVATDATGIAVPSNALTAWGTMVG